MCGSNKESKNQLAPAHGCRKSTIVQRSRRTAIEPMFDLVAKALGTTGRQKQLAIQRLDNVRTGLAIATLTVQVAMIANSIWGLPLRNLSIL